MREWSDADKHLVYIYNQVSKPQSTCQRAAYVDRCQSLEPLVCKCLCEPVAVSMWFLL